MEPGRVAVIFGGASGIGLAVARLCKARGMLVAIGDVDEPLMNEARKEFSEGLVVKCDATSPSEVKAFADTIYTKWQDCGLLMNNTGIMRGDSAFKTSLKDWNQVMDITFNAYVIGTKEFVPRMLAQKNKNAVIVNTSSVAGLINSTRETGAPYTVAKFAARVFTECLALELRDSPIRVHVLCPGPAQTRLMTNSKKDGATFDFESRGINENILEKGIPAAEIAERLEAGIKKGEFYIVVTKPEVPKSILAEFMRFVADDIEQGTPALSYIDPKGKKKEEVKARSVQAFKRAAKSSL